MSVRRTAALALALVAVAAAPALAGPAKALPKPKPLVIADPAGDANGINSQGDLVPVPSQSGQGQRAAADILSVKLGRTDDGKKVTGLAISFTLSAPPDQGTIYRVQMATAECAIFWVSYNVPIGGAVSASMRDDCDTAGTAVTTPLTTFVAKDATITLSAPFKTLNKKIALGSVITETYGETKGHVSTPAASPTVPTIDETAIVTTPYKIGD